MQRALDLVQQMHTETFPQCLASINAVVAQTGLKRPTTLATLKEFVELLDAVDRTLSNYSPQLYQQNLESILHDLSPGRNGGLAAAWALCTSGTYRRARAAILSARNGEAPSRVLFSEVRAAVGELKRWATASEGKSLPMRVDDSAKHVAALERLSRDADSLAKILPETRTDQFSISRPSALGAYKKEPIIWDIRRNPASRMQTVLRTPGRKSCKFFSENCYFCQFASGSVVAGIARVESWGLQGETESESSLSLISNIYTRLPGGNMRLRKFCKCGIVGFSVAIALALVACSDSSTKAAASGQAGVEEAVQTAVDAYVYGYSLITTEVTRVQMSNFPKAEGLHAPMGQFANALRYPPGDYRGVSAPNADTLYSLAWLDLAEPQVFSHPNMGKRFYLFEMTDLWMTDFDTPGSRTEGEAAAKYLITGPGWNGTVPTGMKQIKAATRYIVILGRTYANGTDQDYKAVNALQAQYAIIPLGAYGKPYQYEAPPVNANPGFSMTDSPQKVINAMDTSTYFNLLAKLMGGAAPPAPEDATYAGSHGQDRHCSRSAVRHVQAGSGRADRA